MPFCYLVHNFLCFAAKQSINAKIKYCKPAFLCSYFIFLWSFGCWVVAEISWTSLLRFSFINVFNKFDIFAWIEWIGDSYWFCSLSNQNANFMETLQSFIILLPFPTKKTTKNDVTLSQILKRYSHALMQMCIVIKSFACVKYIKVMCYITKNFWQNQK